LEISAPHTLTFTNKKHIPLEEIAQSLLATDRLAQHLPAALEALFPGLQVHKVVIDLEQLRRGSVFEDFILKVFCDHQSDLETARD
jgi:hypothetical protein